MDYVKLKMNRLISPFVLVTPIVVNLQYYYVLVTVGAVVEYHYTLPEVTIWHYVVLF